MLRAARLALAAAILAAAAPLRAEPVSIPIAEVADSAEVRREGDAIRHLASQYLFPAQLGQMPARKLVVYAPGNISVQYTLRGGGNGDGWIDLFVYRPDEGTLADEAQSLEALLIERYKGTPLPTPQGFTDPGAPVMSGWYDAEIGGKPYLTYYQLARHGDWAVKIRFSMPREATDDVRSRAAEALADRPTRWR